MRAVDRKAAAALRDDGAGRARAVAPIDRRGEVARRCIRIGVGEGRDRRAADRSPFRAADGRAAGSQRCVGHVRSCSLALAVLPPTSLMVTPTVYVPSSA